jgi:rhamnosyltransferase
MIICGVVVTYNSGKEILDNIDANIKQFTKIVIVDNDSDIVTINYLNEIQNKYSNKIDIIFNSNNFGLSKAQNLGIERALSFKPEWIMILDDDSKLNDNSITNMINVYRSINNRNNIAMLIPSVIDKYTNRESKYIIKKNFIIKRLSFAKECRVIRDVLTAIASGSLIKSSILYKYKMNERLFIDYIDIDFCLTLNNDGYEIVAIKDGLLVHSLGERSLINLFGKKIHINNHKPFRKYYIYRNRIYIWKKYFNIYSSYVIYEFCVSIIDFFKIIIFEKNKKENLLKIFKGVKEGINYEL